MAKQGVKTAVPRLRFPGFEGNPHWTISKLGTRGRFLGGGTPSRENAEFWTGIHPWISSSDISDEEIRPVRPSRFITDEAVARSATQVVPVGSVLIVARVGVGKVAVSEEKLHTSQDFANLVPSSDSPVFLAYLLKSRKSALLAFNQGMAIKGFTRDDIAGLEVPIPEKPEQQKIADCLTSLDEVIAAQGRKVEALKAHKRGLMQQLFPREGETRPRLRFPEFRDAPEWEEVPLKSLARYENGKAYEQDILDTGRFVVVNSRFVSTDGTIRKYTNAEYCIATQGDVLMVLSDLPNGKALAKCFHVDTDDRYAVNQRVARLTPTDVDSMFLYFRLNRSSRLLIFDDGLNQTHLSKGNVQDCLLCVPREQKEQQRIADCLTSLDTQITAESDQLATLKTHKQGLMQQLFPAPEAAA